MIASAARGCKAANADGGATTIISADDIINRGPSVEFSSIIGAVVSKKFIEEDDTEIITVSFSSTPRFASLRKFMVVLAGRLVFIRLCYDK